jgi:SAM-dependent methyltransferase
VIHIVCVNAGNYCAAGRRYVETLHAMVANNLPADLAYDFVCFTDDSEEYSYPIRREPLPEGLQGWFNKLYLFKTGLFPAGDLVLFLDLDTLIVDSLEPVLQYSGRFAILQDFLRTGGYGSGVMLWRADGEPQLWDAYEAAGFPLVEGGDQTWIEHNRPAKVDFLQDLFPGRLVSFKVHCADGIPAGAAIVCFHGKPRPHELQTGWVPLVWHTRLASATPGPPPEYFDDDQAGTAEAEFWKEHGQTHIVPQTTLVHPEGFSPGEYVRSFFTGCSQVTEVGCGVGRLAGAFDAARYLGVDINAASLEAARRNCPGHRFELLSEREPLPECDGLLFFTVLLHIGDSALNSMLRRAARAARRIVVAEIMDRRWRRGGNPPVFNREAEEYAAHLNSYGHVLVASERRPYERYNNEKWWAARDTRLTVLVFERASPARGL